MNFTPQLLRRSTCPHCWTAFAPEDVLWVSSHADLLGDPLLGPDQQQRFLPTRFNLEGNALDARGFVCQALACPKCHLSVPRALLETEPTFVSVFGSPGSGKSFLLAAMTWELRRLLPQQFGLSFADADTEANRLINHYEQSLFLNAQRDRPQPLADLIAKTKEVGAELYDVVRYHTQQVYYPRPLLFSVRPLEHHPKHADAARTGRVLCLYDNAGESFEVGKDTTQSPVTRHLAHARLLLFLFDPLQDPRFLDLLRAREPRQRPLADRPPYRQEMILHEAAARVRRHLGLAPGARHGRPLVVVCTKSDSWSSLLPPGDDGEPWVARDRLAGLDLDRLEGRSQALRELLRQACPELVSAAEDFCQEVVFVPVSALGRAPVADASGKGVLRPCDLRPAGVTVPLLYGMCKHMPGLVPSVRRGPDPARAGANSRAGSFAAAVNGVPRP